MWGQRGPVRDALAYLRMQILKGLRMYTQRLYASTLLAAWIMDPCVAGAARIITPPAWLCRSWSRLWFWASVGWARLQSSDGRYGLRLLKPLFQATTDPKLLFQAPKQLRTATLVQLWGRVWKHDALHRPPVSAVTFVCSRLPFGDCKVTIKTQKLGNISGSV